MSNMCAICFNFALGAGDLKKESNEATVFLILTFLSITEIFHFVDGLIKML